MKQWWTAAEIATATGLSVRTIRWRAQKNLWKSRAIARGKGHEYALASLPPEVREHLEAAANEPAAPQLVEQAPAPSKRRPSRVANAKRSRAIASGAVIAHGLRIPSP